MDARADSPLLSPLARRAREASLPFDIAGAAEAREKAGHIAQQIEDHLAPRLASLEAPLLAVVGGSTGSGKSTLVNALVGENISRAGALRPTTRQPVLVHNPSDAQWFEGDRILPSLPRVHMSASSPEARERGAGFGTALHLVESERVPQGIALLDAPDIDSVSRENRELAGQLLRAADLWIFVTTAHRYADAVPWLALAQAAEREVTVVVIMNRIPHKDGVAEDLTSHLGAMLAERGVMTERLLAIHEQELGEGEILETDEVRELSAWLGALARDKEARSAIARRTLRGALVATAQSLDELGEAVAAQEDERDRLAALARAEFDAAKDSIANLTRDGALLRGEVLARWQDVVGTGEFFKGVQGWVSRTRDRITAALTGRTRPVVAAENAIETGLVTVVIDQVANARSRTVRAWNSHAAGASLLQSSPGLAVTLMQVPEGFRRTVEDQVRAWQKDVLDLVESEGSDRRTQARVLSLGVNVVGIALMVVVFASTAFMPTGLEVGAGTATALVGQKLLESIFGDEAVRRLAKKARGMLDSRIGNVVDTQATAFATALAAHPIATASSAIHSDAETVRQLIENLGGPSAAPRRGGQ
ncbi:dynamin family protein [Dermabacter hominis]|uniref:dynamin family protein n=1 Tax=Dermabacter hominis TaxID=36740 RepID=UPI00223AF24D|nr:dynamin family protein [Dermabacter hominis]MCT2024580.1 dynamin family protein [Dermabacter hominis]